MVDVAPIQLENLWWKVKQWDNIFLDCQDASQLAFEDETFDQVLLFFLLHELPLEVRKRTVREVVRVTRPGGKIVFVDYHRPVWQNPHRYFMPLVLKTLEPFAMDLWNTEITEWIEEESRPRSVEKTTYFGGLYQKVVLKL